MRRRTKQPAALQSVGDMRRRDDAAHLMATAIAFDSAGRPVPGHVLRRLWGLRSAWKGRKDVPGQVTRACALLDRQADNAREVAT